MLNWATLQPVQVFGASSKVTVTVAPRLTPLSAWLIEAGLELLARSTAWNPLGCLAVPDAYT